jgi:hypothetical protein
LGQEKKIKEQKINRKHNVYFADPTFIQGLATGALWMNDDYHRYGARLYINGVLTSF